MEWGNSQVGLCEPVTACDPEASKQITKTVDDAIALVSKVLVVWTDLT